MYTIVKHNGQTNIKPEIAAARWPPGDNRPPREPGSAAARWPPGDNRPPREPGSAAARWPPGDNRPPREGHGNDERTREPMRLGQQRRSLDDRLSRSRMGCSG